MSIPKKAQMTAQGPQKLPGYYSWRHATNAEQMNERELYALTRSRQARRRRANERQSSRAARSVAAQLTLLDHRSGNARRERSRLSAVSS